VPLTFVARPSSQHTLKCAPATTGVVSWNTAAKDGAIALRLHYVDGVAGDALPYASWSEHRRSSLGGADARAHIQVDVLHSTVAFDTVEVRATARLDALALATPPSPSGGDEDDTSPVAIDLDVPQLSQYLEDGEPGWCSPAALAMLLRYHGHGVDLREVVRATHDDAYGGTGNWAFNVAFASRFGLRAFVAYLRDLGHAQRFLEAGVPLALSYSWSADDLPGAPLEQSAGHLAVLRGFDGGGAPLLNDPAHPEVRTSYPRAELERLWLRGGGVAYVIAPQVVPIVELANGERIPVPLPTL
jgi:hypothetical protein